MKTQYVAVEMDDIEECINDWGGLSETIEGCWNEVKDVFDPDSTIICRVTPVATVNVVKTTFPPILKKKRAK